jgi:hypothetical protein
MERPLNRNGEKVLMRRVLISLVVILAALAAASCAGQEQRDVTTTGKSQPPNTSRQATPPAPPREQAGAHGHETSSSRVPAFQTDAASLKSLAPTLPPNHRAAPVLLPLR